MAPDDELESQTADSPGERTTWFRALVGIHILLVLVLMADVWERNHVVFPGIVPIGMFMVAIQGAIALAAILPLASFGLVLPAVAVDIAAALLLPRGTGALAPVFAAGFGAAAGIGLTLQAMVIRDWRRGDMGGWGRRIAKGLGIVVAAGVVLAAGLYLYIWFAFADHVHPEYLDLAQADPMAVYEAPGAVLDDRREVEAADTWKAFRSAEITQTYSIEPSVDPESVYADAIADAEAAGWTADRPAGDNVAYLSKDRLSLAIMLIGDEDRQLIVRLRNP